MTEETGRDHSAEHAVDEPVAKDNDQCTGHAPLDKAQDEWRQDRDPVADVGYVAEDKGQNTPEQRLPSNSDDSQQSAMSFLALLGGASTFALYYFASFYISRNLLDVS